MSGGKLNKGTQQQKTQAKDKLKMWRFSGSFFACQHHKLLAMFLVCKLLERKASAKMNASKCNTQLNWIDHISAYTRVCVRWSGQQLWTLSLSLSWHYRLWNQKQNVWAHSLHYYCSIMIYKSVSAEKSHATAWLKEQNQSVWKRLLSIELFRCESSSMSFSSAHHKQFKNSDLFKQNCF